MLAETLAREQVTAPDVCVAYPLRGPALDALARIARDHPGVRLAVLCEDPELVRSVPPELGVFVDVRLLELLDRVQAAGLEPEELLTSGTPGFRAAIAYPPFAELARRRGVAHRVSPGTVVVHDARSEEQNGDLGLVPAAWVLSRVVSRPAAGIVTCDAGSKALAAEAGGPCAIVAGHPELVALPPSEEHLPRVTSGPGPARGAVLALVPRHACPTVNLAETALLRDGDDVRVVSIRARVHDVAVRVSFRTRADRRRFFVDDGADGALDGTWSDAVTVTVQ